MTSDDCGPTFCQKQPTQPDFQLRSIPKIRSTAFIVNQRILNKLGGITECDGAAGPENRDVLAEFKRTSRIRIPLPGRLQGGRWRLSGPNGPGGGMSDHWRFHGSATSRKEIFSVLFNVVNVHHWAGRRYNKPRVLGPRLESKIRYLSSAVAAGWRQGTRCFNLAQQSKTTMDLELTGTACSSDQS
jgi:hypothetical protein